MKPDQKKQTDPAAEARRAAGYLKRPNDFITAREAVLMMDTRVSVLLAHWEDRRRNNVWWRRLYAWMAGRAS